MYFFQKLYLKLFYKIYYIDIILFSLYDSQNVAMSSTSLKNLLDISQNEMNKILNILTKFKFITLEYEYKHQSTTIIDETHQKHIININNKYLISKKGIDFILQK